MLGRLEIESRHGFNPGNKIRMMGSRIWQAFEAPFSLFFFSMSTGISFPCSPSPQTSKLAIAYHILLLRLDASKIDLLLETTLPGSCLNHWSRCHGIHDYCQNTSAFCNALSEKASDRRDDGV